MKLAYHGSTTAMRTHLQNRHKNVALQEQKEQVERHQKMIRFVVAIRSCDSKQQGQITALVTSMITDDMLPLSIVEGEGFKRLMEFVEPEYTMPSCKTITRNVEKKYRGRYCSKREVNEAISTLLEENYSAQETEQNEWYFSEPHISPDENLLLCWKHIVSNILPSTPYNT